MSNLHSYILSNIEAYREFFDNAHDLIHIVEPDGEIIYVNNSWKRLLGYSTEEIRGASIYSLVHHDDRDRFIDYRQQIISGDGTLQQITIGLIAKGGYKVYVEGSVAPKVVNGRVIYTSGIFRDVTARLRDEAQLKLMNEALKEREANLQHLLFHAPDAIIVVDTQSKVTYWNPKAAAIFGWSPEEVIGKPLTQLIIPEKHRPAHDAGMKRYLQTGEARVLNRTIEITALNKEGKEFYVSLTISTTQQRGHISFIAFIRDIDEQKRNERELEEKRAQLETSNRELERFAYVASHDMKEPVRKILMFLQRLRSESADLLPLNAELYVSKMENAGIRLIEMIDGVLAYSSLKGEKIVTEKVNLNQVIEHVQRDLELVLEEKKGVVRCLDLPVVEGSPFLLYQLFYNLVSNSLKFSKPNVSPVIEITATKDLVNSLVEITIKDNGIGFPQQYAEEIFNTFSRLHPKHRFEGTGLGLSICKSIVEKHNGAIKAFGNENAGATFTIQLPERQRPG